MITNLYLRTKTSTTHLFQCGIASDTFYRKYDPETKTMRPDPHTFVITTCGQRLSGEHVTIRRIVTGREVKCGDCRWMLELVSKGVDISDDILRGVA